MDHPLAMDVEAMRRTGYAAVDALVARLADPGADPVLRRASPAEMESRLGRGWRLRLYASRDRALR